MSPADVVFIGIEQWKKKHLALVDNGQISITHGAQDITWNCQTVFTYYKIRMIYRATPSAWTLMIDRNVSSDEIAKLNLPVLYVMLLLDDMFEKLRSRKEGIMPAEMNSNAKVDNDQMLKMAKAAVVCWYNTHNGPDFIDLKDVFIVWFSKTLRDWKALAATHHSDGMYYEVTFDGDRECAYVDAYKKWDNTTMTSDLLREQIKND